MVYKNNIVVVLKVDGKILREEGEFVTLPFGSEYSILFKNLESRRAVIDVEIDGQDVLDGSRLILEPNSTSELEGFKKGNKVTNKFKFIQKTKQIAGYRGDKIDDGFIRILATFEEENEWVYSYNHYVDYSNNQKYNTGFPTPQVFYSQTISLDSCAETKTSGGIGHSSCGTRRIKANSCFMDLAPTEPTEPKQDEGITVKGNDNSKQTFKLGHTKTLEANSHTIILRLRGIKKASKFGVPVFVTSKRKCETCGKVSKSNVKFCSNCGTCLKD